MDQVALAVAVHFLDQRHELFVTRTSGTTSGLGQPEQVGQLDQRPARDVGSQVIGGRQEGLFQSGHAVALVALTESDERRAGHDQIVIPRDLSQMNM